MFIYVDPIETLMIEMSYIDFGDLVVNEVIKEGLSLDFNMWFAGMCFKNDMGTPFVLPQDAKRFCLDTWDDIEYRQCMLDYVEHAHCLKTSLNIKCRELLKEMEE